jgi:hypothetical protein
MSPPTGSNEKGRLSGRPFFQPERIVAELFLLADGLIRAASAALSRLSTALTALAAALGRIAVAALLALIFVKLRALLPALALLRRRSHLLEN